MPSVRFEPDGVSVVVPTGTTIGQAARRAGVRLVSGFFVVDNCRGLGICGECRVRVLDGAESLSPAGVRERWAGRPRGLRALVRRGNEPDERLGCQSRVQGDLVLRVRLRELTP